MQAPLPGIDRDNAHMFAEAGSIGREGRPHALERPGGPVHPEVMLRRGRGLVPERWADGASGAPSRADTHLPYGLVGMGAGEPECCWRRAVLRNLPTAVFGISVTNSKRSGSHHLAN